MAQNHPNPYPRPNHKYIPVEAMLIENGRGGRVAIRQMHREFDPLKDLKAISPTL